MGCGFPVSLAVSLADPLAFTRETALAAELHNLGTLYLHLRCGCHLSVVPIAKLNREGRRGTLADALGRMRCPKCRQAPCEAVLAEDWYGPGVVGRYGKADGWWVSLDLPAPK